MVSQKQDLEFNFFEKKPPKDYSGFWASVSKFKTFKTCPKQYNFSYIQRLPKKERDYHIFGKLAHQALETFHQMKIDGDERPDHLIMTDAFKNACEKYKEKMPKDKAKEMRKEAFELLKVFLQKEKKIRDQGQEPKVLAVEEGFYLDINQKVLLNGFIDLVQLDPDGVLHLADYKTSAKDKYLKNDFFQLETYALVKFLQDPSLEKIRCSYIMIRLGFKYITKEITREDLGRIAEKYLKDSEEIQEEKLFRPNPQVLCAWCEFSEPELCPEGYQAKEEYLERKRRKENLENQKPDNWGKGSW